MTDTVRAAALIVYLGACALLALLGLGVLEGDALLDAALAGAATAFLLQVCLTLPRERTSRTTTIAAPPQDAGKSPVPVLQLAKAGNGARDRDA